MISVAIATLDRPEHVLRVLTSLLTDSARASELIVVDQSAGGETRAVVEALGSDAVRYIRQLRPGASAARNRAATEARGEFVAFLDDDCEVPVGWTRTLSAELERLGPLDGLWGEIRAPTGTSVGRGIPAVSTFSVPRARVWPASVHPNRLGYSGHMVVRRSVFADVGGFDERLGPGSPFFGAEDMDLNYRLLRAGARLASTPELWVIHHQWRDPKDLPRLQHDYNYGHSAFCAKHLRAGDGHALVLFAGQVRDDARMFGSAIRRRSRLVARVASRRVAGTWGGLIAGWRAFGEHPR